MSSTLLSICIPTYNRKEILIQRVQEILSLKDERFNVVVQDNNSPDGTSEELALIKDSRLIIRENEENIGSIPNWIRSLSGNNSEYIIFMIDKDRVNIQYLPTFLDYLEEKRPNFGYASPINNNPVHIETYPAGIESIVHAAYLYTHPSGYFYKTKLFEEQISQDYFKKIDKKFDFPFEVIHAHLSVSNASSMVFMPLIRYCLTEVPGKSLSYNGSSVYYTCAKVLETFGLFLSDFLSLEIPLKNKCSYSYRLLARTIFRVTFALRRVYKDAWICEHYHMTQRVVPASEMLKNAILEIKEYRRIARPILALSIVNYDSIRAFIRALYLVARVIMADMIKQIYSRLKC